MTRARILAGAAVLAAACALAAPAQAQFASPCMLLGSPLPPPCIIFDPSKVATMATEISQKTQQIAQLKSQIEQYTSIQGLLGKLKQGGIGSIGGYEPIAPISPITPQAASAELAKVLPPAGLSQEQASSYKKMDALRVRAAAGDGYAIATAIKARLADMATTAAKVESLAAQGSADMRTDWQANTQARALMLRALQTLAEVRAAHVTLVSQNALGSTTPAKSVFTQGTPASTPAASAPNYAEGLGKVSNLSNQLASLLSAKQVAASYVDSINGFRETQAEYQQMLQAAQASEAQLESLASYDASRKRVSAQALLDRANSIMASRDRTVWDDPNKQTSAKAAAGYAESQLDKMVPGDVSNSWGDYLQNRAEAYKQEAYFRPINEEAKQSEQDAIQSLKDYSASLGVDASNPNALDAEIARVQQQLKDAGQSLATAPDQVQAQRDAIYNSTMQSVLQ